MKVAGKVQSGAKSGNGIKVNDSWYNLDGIGSLVNWKDNVEFEAEGKNIVAGSVKVTGSGGSYDAPTRPSTNSYGYRPNRTEYFAQQASIIRQNALTAAVNFAGDDATPEGVLGAAQEFYEWTSAPMKTAASKGSAPTAAPAPVEPPPPPAPEAAKFDDDVPF